MATFDQTDLLTVHNPDGLSDPSGFGYSHVAQVAPGGKLVFVSGQSGEQEDGTYATGFRAQVAQAFHNLLLALHSAGAGPQDVAKLTVYVVEHTEEKLGIYRAELSAAWGAAPLPACTLVPVPRLALDAMLFEVEAVAVVPV